MGRDRVSANGRRLCHPRAAWRRCLICVLALAGRCGSANPPQSADGHRRQGRRGQDQNNPGDGGVPARDQGDQPESFSKVNRQNYEKKRHNHPYPSLARVAVPARDRSGFTDAGLAHGVPGDFQFSIEAGGPRGAHWQSTGATRPHRARPGERVVGEPRGRRSAGRPDRSLHHLPDCRRSESRPEAVHARFATRSRLRTVTAPRTSCSSRWI